MTLIIVLFKEIECGGFLYLINILTNADFREARAIIRGLDTNIEKEFRVKVVNTLYS
jgi:hypothetical protein